MKAGAVDFLTKPVKRDALFSAVIHAAELDATSRRKRQESKSIDERLATLTHREREVLEHVIAGRLNKQIAASLGTVEKTIKVHRGRMMGKLGVRSVAELVRRRRDGDRDPPQPPDYCGRHLFLSTSRQNASSISSKRTPNCRSHTEENLSARGR